MIQILPSGKKCIFILAAFFQLIGCFGQETSFLNKYFFTVTDTSQYKPSFYQEKHSYPDSTITEIYTLEGLLVKEEQKVVDNQGKETYRITLQFDSLGNLQSRVESDIKASSDYPTTYYSDGQLRSRHQYINSQPVLEDHFDEIGMSVNKPDEVYPLPHGGMEAWYRYLSKNMLYPKTSARKKPEGTVFIYFVVDTDGGLVNPEVMNPEQVSPLLAAEALRLINQYPHLWSPGTKDGIAIPVPVRLPIGFSHR